MSLEERYRVQVFPVVRSAFANRMVKRTFFVRAPSPGDAFDMARAIVTILEHRTVEHSFEDAVIEAITSDEQEDLV